MFIPTTKAEIDALGWERPDIILITGDTYIDSPFLGYVVIGKVLLNAGYKVGIIAQPALDRETDITRLGEPALFWGITGGCMDSMVSNYTPTGKFRQKDDLTPGCNNYRRPDRAVIRYCNLIRKYYKETVPLVIGGMEASLRRITHYDYWDNKVRNSILFDAKADILLYGMAEKSILELAAKLKTNRDYRDIRGLCYIAPSPVDSYRHLPSADAVKNSKESFIRMFDLFYRNTDPLTAQGMVQAHGERYLIHNPPQFYETTEELDNIYELPYTYAPHPFYSALGEIRALDTIRFSLTTHRGCYGECHFCAISVHQGKTVRSRSEASIIREAERFTHLKEFKGIIQDAGGATANMYGIECRKKISAGACSTKRCLFPRICSRLPVNHRKQITLLTRLKTLPGVKKVFVASGIRHDMVLADKTCGREYLEVLLEEHTSGQMKIAPEHTDKEVLCLMGKPADESLADFIKLFTAMDKNLGHHHFLTYYFIAAHPGCSLAEMTALKQYLRTRLKIKPEQVQIFTPTPSTYSTLMYYTGTDPFTGKKIFVEKDKNKKQEQKAHLSR